jgi:hypothetical protein
MFQTLDGQIRAMLNGAGLPEEVKGGIWAECACTAAIFYSKLLATRVKKFPTRVSFW